MRLRQQFLTKNDCYQAGRTITVKGVMVHSTGANNPNVSRYVPGDDEIGRNRLDNHWNRPGMTKCVHAFLGKFADGEVGVVQTLPWNCRGWHGGGSSNNTHIGFEICEDGLTDPVYFGKVYREAVELTAMLCRQYGLDPLKEGVVICHQEGYRQGVASNHADVLHWFPQMGKTMDDFRADTARAMRGENAEMTYEQWKEYMERYRKELGRLPAPKWGEQELKRAVELGITDGSSPCALASRQEVISMIVRARQNSI